MHDSGSVQQLCAHTSNMLVERHDNYTLPGAQAWKSFSWYLHSLLPTWNRCTSSRNETPINFRRTV